MFLTALDWSNSKASLVNPTALTFGFPNDEASMHSMGGEGGGGEGGGEVGGGGGSKTCAG